MALSASQSRSTSKWTTDLLDITHFPSADGSRIEDSRIVRLVKKHSNTGNGDQGEKFNSPKRGQLENSANSSNDDDGIKKKNNNSPSSKSAKPTTKPKSHLENAENGDDKQLKNKNINNNKQLKQNNNNNNKPKALIFGGGALLKKLFGRKSGKYEKSTHGKNNNDNNNRFGNIGDGEDDDVTAPIVVKEYDPTSQSVLRFNNYSRNRFTRDGSSVVFTNNNNNNNTENTNNRHNNDNNNVKNSVCSLDSLRDAACCCDCEDSRIDEDDDNVHSDMILQTSLSNESRNRQTASTRRLMNEDGISDKDIRSDKDNTSDQYCDKKIENDKDINSDMNNDKEKEFVVGTFTSQQGAFHR